jgi:predicted ATPase
MNRGSVNVITAGPSAGKSSTIRELSARGYQTLPEAARILFDQRISEGDDPETVREEPDFHEQVESIDKRIESNIPSDEPVFLDRALADNLAYRTHFGNDTVARYDTIRDTVYSRYDNVFMLDRLTFEDDAVRSEDEQEAQALHELLVQTYSELECDVYTVPLKPVDERVEFILDRI